MNLFLTKNLVSKKQAVLFYLLFFIFCNNQAIAQSQKELVYESLKQFEKYAYADKDSAVYYLRKAELTAMGSPADLIRVYGRKSDFFTFVMSDTDSSLVYLDKAIKLAPKINDSILIAQIYNKKGYVLKMGWKIEEAKFYYNKAISILEKTNKYMQLTNSYVKKGKLYASVELYDEAFLQFDKALQLTTKTDKIDKAFIYINMANTYKKKGDYDDAEIHFEKAIEIIKKKKPSKKKQAQLTRNNTNLAAIAFEKGNYKKALTLALKSEKWIKKEKKKKTIIGLHLLMGDIYYELGNDSLALHFAEKAYKKATKKNIPLRMLEGAKLLAVIHERQGNYKKAVGFLQLYETMNVVYAKQEAKEALLKEAYLQTIREKDQEIEATQKEVTTKSRNILFISLFFIGLLGVGFILYRRKKHRFLKQLEKSKYNTSRIKENLQTAQKKTVQVQNELDTYLRLLSKHTNPDDETELLQMKSTMQQLYDFKILTEDDWLTFKSLFLNVYPEFYKNFKTTVADYSLGDLKLASLIRLNFNTKEIAKILAISPESVRKGKYRLRKKMTFSSEKELQKFIYTL